MWGRSSKSKLVIISIFLISFFLIGSVYGEDNATDSDTQTVDDINVSFPEKVYKEDLGEIDVQMPENKSGNLKATLNSIEFYNENVTGSVKIPIRIPQKAFSIYAVNRITDHSTYGISLFFNGLEIKSNHTLMVMNNPRNFTVPGFASEILKDDADSHISLFFPESADGGAEIYIDGQFSHNVATTTFTFLNQSEFISLPLGMHSVGIRYLGDDYYYPFYENFTFEVVDMLISIPKNMVLDHDDCITAKILNNTDGIVTVYVDNKTVFKDKLDNRGEFLHSMFSDITCGSHLIEVKYAAANFTKSKRANVNVSYTADIWGWGYQCGDDNYLVIMVPPDFDKNSIRIKINNREFKNFKIDNDGWIEVDLSTWGPGKYFTSVDLLAGKKYYGISLSYNFTIMPGTLKISNVNAVYSQKGYVKVYVNGETLYNKYITLKIGKNTYRVKTNERGVAAFKTSLLKPGKYTITVGYATLKSSKTLTVKHLLSLYDIKLKKSTKKVTLKVKLAKKLKNRIIKFKFRGKVYSAKTNKKGIAKVTVKVKNLKAGKKITYQASYQKDVVKRTVVVKK